MRLLTYNRDNELELQTFSNGKIPPYAILSHTWYTDNTQEVSYQDFTTGTADRKIGYGKISFCKRQAATNNLHHFWIDTYCIDKTSSTELSEAINSMFKWYLDSSICLIYLSDVIVRVLETKEQRAEFAASKWWTRGWTLQELIAPRHAVFYNSQGERIGGKDSLVDLIEEITGVPKEVTLDSKRMYKCSVAQRMSWAAKRTTTRKEDMAYALMGLFNVNMPLLYGENEKAFVRLQEEILKDSTDQSIFAWSHGSTVTSDSKPLHESGHELQGILAMDPRCFSASSTFCPVSNSLELPQLEILTTNVGIRMNLVLINGKTALWAVLLATSSTHDTSRSYPKNGRRRAWNGKETMRNCLYIAIAVWPDPEQGGRLMRLASILPKLIDESEIALTHHSTQTVYFSKTNFSQQTISRNHLQVEIKNTSRVSMFGRCCRYAQLTASVPITFEAKCMDVKASELRKTWSFWRPERDYRIVLLVDVTDGSPGDLRCFTIPILLEYSLDKGQDLKWGVHANYCDPNIIQKYQGLGRSQESSRITDLNVAANCSQISNQSQINLSIEIR